MASFTKEVNPRLAKRPLKTNGRLANSELTSLVKEAIGRWWSISPWLIITETSTLVPYHFTQVTATAYIQIICSHLKRVMWSRHRSLSIVCQRDMPSSYEVDEHEGYELPGQMGSIYESCLQTASMLLTNLTNPTKHLSHIPECTTQNRNAHVSVLNSAWWDVEQVHCGICGSIVPSSFIRFWSVASSFENGSWLSALTPNIGTCGQWWCCVKLPSSIKLKSRVLQVAKSLGSMSNVHRSDTEVSNRCIIDVDPKIFVIWEK